MSLTPSVVITGASRGIGAAIAARCGAEGYRLALIARSEVPLRAVAASVGGGAAVFPCDVTDAAAVARTAAEITAALGAPPDVLINNAGLFQLARADTMSPADFSAVVQTNLVAPFLLTRAFLSGMRQRGSGTILTLGSVADRTAFPENGAYAASKYGLRALHEAMRAELRGSGVRAMLVSPGPVDTPLWDPLNPDARPGFTPRAQMLTAHDVADAVWFAISRPVSVNIDELRLSRS
jgi:NADP-dependent 3-hydroxy acid dehydrogenase YdfG